MNENGKIDVLFCESVDPPAKTSIIYWWIFHGDMTESRISNEISYISDLGFKQVLIAAGHNVSPKYLRHVKSFVSERDILTGKFVEYHRNM